MRTTGVLDQSQAFDFARPVQAIDDKEEKQMARIGNSKQWKLLKQTLLERRVMYSRQLPGGINYKHMSREDAAYYGSIADCVIDEIDHFILLVETMSDATK